ncbi:MAG: LPS-assembly protein LptD [Bauldia sp.]|nr:LPS-assembly protein LptD [Bauldia sp.]
MTFPAIRFPWHPMRALRAAAVACIAVLLAISPAAAQAQMDLTSDEFVFDYDNEVLSAVGNVRITYRGYVLTADRVTYYQATGRLIAAGNVRIVDPSGDIYESQYADVTDDFSEGFVTEIFVQTADRTFFTAETATRSGGRITDFDRATYTACAIIETAGKPPLWQVRAARIVHNQEEEMIYFERARLEFFGVPVAYVPYLAMPDPSVTRKTGFLFPEFSYSAPLGVGFGVPYFWAPAPNYDLTLTPTFFTRQGFLGEVEWRHRLNRGLYTFQAAGISQRNGAAFGDPPGRSFRGAVRTTGDFAINRFWSFGWDGTLQTDRGFTNAYDAVNPGGPFITSEIYLVGLNDRTFVDAHIYHFADVRRETARTDQDRQAIVHPTVDHEYILATPVLGGELALAGNLTSLSRGANDPFTIGADTYHHGLAGTFTRLSEQLTWRRRLFGPAGMVFEPFVFARADAFFLSPDAPPPGFSTEAAAFRGMAGGGLEWRWPWLLTNGASRHVVEPIAQLIVRPSETMIGALPNDDAQSLVFDTSNLLAWNKFSGWDRVEGGTRLNLALRYLGQFGGTRLEAMVGQSYHLAGVNSFAVPDVANTGGDTGLEDNVSDIVAGLSLTSAQGHSLVARGRFDPSGFSVEHASLDANLSLGALTTTAGVAFDPTYVDIEGTPRAGFLINGSAALELSPNWTVFGSLGYDVISSTLVSSRLGVQYECDCASFSVVYSARRSPGSTDVNRSIMFGLTLRTLADLDVTVSP